MDNSTQYAVSKVRVELIRRYGYAMLNIYIPSFTLLIISYITLYFRPSIFEVRWEGDGEDGKWSKYNQMNTLTTSHSVNCN